MLTREVKENVNGKMFETILKDKRYLVNHGPFQYNNSGEAMSKTVFGHFAVTMKYMLYMYSLTKSFFLLN